MSSIGRSKHIRCSAPGCNKQAPYWSRLCKAHRIARDQVASDQVASDQVAWRVVIVAAYVWGARNVYKIERNGEYASFMGVTYWTNKRGANAACKAINTLEGIE
jgi:hypothetical protein